MYETPTEGMLCTVGANIVGMRMVPEVLTACICVVVLSLIMNVVMVPMVMCSVFNVVDMEVWALAGCDAMLMGEWLALLKICNMSCGSSD